MEVTSCLWWGRLLFFTLFTPFCFNPTAASAPSCVRAESKWREVSWGTVSCQRATIRSLLLTLQKKWVGLLVGGVWFVFFSWYAGVFAECPWKCFFPHPWVSAARCVQFSMLLPSSGVPLPAAVSLQCWAALRPTAVLLPFFFSVSDLVSTRLFTIFI